MLVERRNAEKSQTRKMKTMNTATPSQNDRRRILDVPCNDLSIAAEPTKAVSPASTASNAHASAADHAEQGPKVTSMMDAFRAARQSMNGRTESDLVTDAIVDGDGPGSLRWDLQRAADADAEAHETH